MLIWCYKYSVNLYRSRTFLVLGALDFLALGARVARACVCGSHRCLCWHMASGLLASWLGLAHACVTSEREGPGGVLAPCLLGLVSKLVPIDSFLDK
jgi:hypothetical protein